MFYREIDLYESFPACAAPKGHAGTLRIYAPQLRGDLDPKRRPAILILPGGGYQMTSEREKEPVALRFLSMGFVAFVLEYTVKTAYPVPLLEGAMAMRYIRAHAEEYGADPDRVAAIGFSAGGHLCGMLAVHCGEALIRERLGEGKNFPDAVILSYPVVTAQDGIANEESMQEISGRDRTLREALSLERCVDRNSAPAFIWHTGEDNAVAVENSMLLAGAYRRAGVPFELHIFERGWHGVSVVSAETDRAERLAGISHLAVWVPLAVNWLRARGFAVSDV